MQDPNIKGIANKVLSYLNIDPFNIKARYYTENVCDTLFRNDTRMLANMILNPLKDKLVTKKDVIFLYKTKTSSFYYRVPFSSMLIIVTSILILDVDYDQIIITTKEGIKKDSLEAETLLKLSDIKSGSTIEFKAINFKDTIAANSAIVITNNKYRHGIIGR